MSKNKFNDWLFSTFSHEELSNINPVIYLNPDHIDYYMRYLSGDYKWCKAYLIKHRHLLGGAQ
jgi:hypothetical protein